MMKIFIDGFEQFKDEPSMVGKLARAGYSPAANGSLTSVNGRQAGAQGLQTSDGAFRRAWDWTGQSFAAGTAFMMLARGCILMLEAGEQKIVAWMEPETGAPMLHNVRGGSLPWQKVWYYLEVSLDRNAGIATLWLNGREEVASVPLSSAAIAADKVTVSWGSANPGIALEGMPFFGGTVTYDDIYISDGERLGPLTVTTRFPTSSGPTEWQHSPDAESNHDAVSRRPPKEVDVNVASGDIGARDFYQSTARLPNGNRIVVTGLCVLARKSPALAADLGLQISGPGLVQRARQVEVENTWKTLYVTFDPQATDTKDGIEASSFGLQVVGTP